MQFLDFFILFGLVFQFGVGLDLDTEDDTVAAFIPEQMVPLGICNNRGRPPFRLSLFNPPFQHALFFSFLNHQNENYGHELIFVGSETHFGRCF